ncbi:MAG: Methyltransferase type 11 [Tardiphaga sp.]|nr:Methyltransferase type 11 [Tardiphaga sp.]
MTAVRDARPLAPLPMVPPSLPPAITAALEARLHGLSRVEAARRQSAISRTYRGGGGSEAIRTEADALTYALARMPATYAAVTACLNAIGEINPDFAPKTLLDCGAGPGTASWAIATWAASHAVGLDAITLLDANPALRALALTLADAMALTPRYDLGDIGTTLASAEPTDFVVASYVINELPAAQQASLADALWAKTNDTLLVVEPGTPAGYARIIALRSRLIAQGAHVIAPCPHDDACPLASPDWCHFVQRLPRSRAHMALKAAEVPVEDEKFTYVALSRSFPSRRPPRVLAPPDITKIAVTAKLCTADGLAFASAPKRDKPAYQRFKKLGWGDAVS